jgi:hypothetical protein
MVRKTVKRSLVLHMHAKLHVLIIVEIYRSNVNKILCEILFSEINNQNQIFERAKYSIMYHTIGTVQCHVTLYIHKI